MVSIIVACFFYIPCIRNVAFGVTAVDNRSRDSAKHWMVVPLCCRRPPMVSVYTRSPLGSSMVGSDIEGGGGTMSLNRVPFIIQKIFSVSECLHLY